MKRNFEKNVHVLNQLMGYCKKIGGSEIETKMSFIGEHTLISVTTPAQNIDQSELDELRKQLELPRQPEVEENYWNIGLSGNLGDEMALVGMMTDKFSIDYNNGVLTIGIERENDSRLWY